MTLKFGLPPSEVDRMPMELLEAYFDHACPDTMTFADERALAKYLASMNK
jgi:hypothetical protein